jgi:hypothetical protein
MKSKISHIKLKLKVTEHSPMAHACNPSYSRSRDQKDHGLKSALGKEFRRPYLKKKIFKSQKKG